MKPDPEEDSQIVEPDHRLSDEYQDYLPSVSDQSKVWDGDINHNHCAIHARQSADHIHDCSLDVEAQDSNTFRVEETQFQSIELAQEPEPDSFPSVITETRYTTIDSTTQVLNKDEENSPHSVSTSPSLRNSVAPNGFPTSTDSLSPEFSCSLSRTKESLDGIGEDFAFAQASKPPLFGRSISVVNKTLPYVADICRGGENDLIIHDNPKKTLHRYQKEEVEQPTYSNEPSLTILVQSQAKETSNRKGKCLATKISMDQEGRGYSISPELQHCSFNHSSTSQAMAVLFQSSQQDLGDTYTSTKLSDHGPGLQNDPTMPSVPDILSPEQKLLLVPVSNDDPKSTPEITGQPPPIVGYVQAMKPQIQTLDEGFSYKPSKAVAEPVREIHASKSGFGAKKRANNILPFPDVAPSLRIRRSFLKRSRGEHELTTQNQKSSKAGYAATDIQTRSITSVLEDDNTTMEPLKQDTTNHSKKMDNITSSTGRTSKQIASIPNGSQVVQKSYHMSPLLHSTNFGKQYEQLESSAPTDDIELQHTNIVHGPDGGRSMEDLATGLTSTNQLLIQEQDKGHRHPTMIEPRTALRISASVDGSNIETGQNICSGHYPNILEPKASVVPRSHRSSTREDYLSEKISDRSHLHFDNNAKITKAKTVISSEGRGMKSNTSVLQRGNSQSNFGILTDYQKFLQSGLAFQEQLNAYEKQKKLVESQKAEISSLSTSGAQSLGRVKLLEDQNQELMQKINKFKGLSKKYHTHINEVVTAQKVLINSGDKIRNDTKRLKDDMEQAKIESETSIKAAKGAMDNVLHTLQIGAKFKKLKEDTLRNNQELEMQVKGLTQKILWLQKDLDERLLDLGRERHNTKNLHKQLTGQKEMHKELVALIKSDTPAMILVELAKNGGIIQKLLESGNLTRERLEDMSTLLNTWKAANQELPLALGKLIEDSYTRVENKLQSSNIDWIVQSDTTTKIFENLKESINQLGLDRDDQGALKTQLTSIREENAIVAVNLKVKEVECQKLATQIEELKQELTSCRSQLTAKYDSLTAILAQSHDDSVFRTKIDLLEVTNVNLRGEAAAVKQDLIRFKDEVRALKESSIQSQDRIRNLEGNLSNAQESLKSAANEQRKLFETSRADMLRAKQEVGKAADLARKEVQMRHESVIKNLEQSRKEAVVQEKEAIERLRNSEDENLALANSIEKLQFEISGYQEKLTDQAAQIEQLYQRPTTEELNNRVSVYNDQLNHQAAKIEELELLRKTQVDFELTRRQEIQSVRSDAINIQTDLENVRTEFSKKLDTALHSYSEIESRLQQAHASEMEKEILRAEKSSLKEEYNKLILARDALVNDNSRLEEEKKSLNSQSLQLQQKYDTLADSVSRHLRRQGILNASESVENWAFDVPMNASQKAPPVYPTPDEAIQAALDRSYTAAGTVIALSEHQNDHQQGNTTTSLTSMKCAPPSQRFVETPNFLQSNLGSGGNRSLIGGTPRSLKLANRRSSNPTQQFENSNRLSTRVESSSYIESTTTHMTQRRRETISRVDTPVNQMIPALQRRHTASTRSKSPAGQLVTFSQQRSGTITSPDNSSCQTIPFSQIPQIEHTSTSSPLSDVDASAIVEGQAIYQQNKSTKSILSRNNSIDTVQRTPPVPQGTRKISCRKRAPPKYTISETLDDIDESEIVNITKQSRHTVKSVFASQPHTGSKISESSPKMDSINSKVLPPKPLKSAMKNTNHTASISVNLAQNANTIKVSKIPETTSGIQVLQHKPIARGLNRNLSGSMQRFSGISNVKGLVSGTNPASKNPGNDNSSRKQQTSALEENLHSENRKSPLMSAPQRNIMKRKASNDLKDLIALSKSAKAPRQSTNFSAISRTEVPDSQEYLLKYHF